MCSGAHGDLLLLPLHMQSATPYHIVHAPFFVMSCFVESNIRKRWLMPTRPYRNRAPSRCQRWVRRWVDLGLMGHGSNLWMWKVEKYGGAMARSREKLAKFELYNYMFWKDCVIRRMARGEKLKKLGVHKRRRSKNRHATTKRRRALLLRQDVVGYDGMLWGLRQDVVCYDGMLWG